MRGNFTCRHPKTIWSLWYHQPAISRRDKQKEAFQEAFAGFARGFQKLDLHVSASSPLIGTSVRGLYYISIVHTGRAAHPTMTESLTGKKSFNQQTLVASFLPTHHRANMKTVRKWLLFSCHVLRTY